MTRAVIHAIYGLVTSTSLKSAEGYSVAKLKNFVALTYAVSRKKDDLRYNYVKPLCCF